MRAALLLLAVPLSAAGCVSLPTPAQSPPAGSVDAARLTYAQNASHLAACDAYVDLEAARQVAETAVGPSSSPAGSPSSLLQVGPPPVSADGARAAAEQAWGPFGYPNDYLGTALAAADKAVAAFTAAGAPGPGGGGTSSATASPAEQAMQEAFRVLESRFGDAGVTCPG
jgi:hypothetical protein